MAAVAKAEAGEFPDIQRHPLIRNGDEISIWGTTRRTASILSGFWVDLELVAWWYLVPSIWSTVQSARYRARAPSVRYAASRSRYLVPRPALSTDLSLVATTWAP